MIFKIFRELKKYKILSAFLLTTGSLLILLLFSGFNVYYSNCDDYIQSLFICEGYDANPYLSYFLTVPLVYLQKIFTEINLFIILQCILCFASFIAIDYALLERFGNKLGTAFSLVVNFIYISTALIFIQYTQTTTVVCFSGYLLLLLQIFKEESGTKKVIQSICAFLLIVLGSWYRFTSFEVVTLAVASFIACLFVTDILRKKNNKIPLKTAIIGIIKKYYKSLILILAAAFLTLGINFLSEILKVNSPDYVTFKEYNAVRSAAVDYTRAPYAGNEDFYNSIDIYSQNDVDCLGKWLGDYEFFNVERLTKISEYSSKFEIRYGFWIDKFQEKFSKLTGNNAGVVISGAVLIALTVLVLLYKFRNKVKFIFPFGIIILWGIFFFIFKITYLNILCMPICILSVISTFLCNRYQYGMILSANIFVFVLYIYLFFTRALFRATYTFLFPVFILLLFSASKSNLRVLFQNKDFKLRRLGLSLIAFVVAAASLFTDSVLWNNLIEGKDIEEKTNVDINPYIQEYDDKTYVFGGNALLIFYFHHEDAFYAPKIPDNIVGAVGWAVGSTYYLDQIDTHNIPRMYNDMIDNDNVSFVLDDSRKELIELFYNEHYAKQNEKMTLKAEKEFQGYAIYNVIRESK